MEHKPNDEYESEFYAADDDFPLIPDGEYYAECTEYKLLDYNSEKKKLYLCFQIFSKARPEDELYIDGVENVIMPFNMPLNGRRIGIRSKYYKTWRMVHGKVPTRGARLSPKKFKNKFYKIKTKTVKQYENGEARPDDKQYSIVDKIIKVIEKRDKNTPTTHF